MDILLKDRAPFILTILLGIMSWQIGEYVAQAREGKILIYSQTDAPGEQIEYTNYKLLKIHNPSRSESVGPFDFALICQNGGECFSGNARAITVEPMFPQGVSTERSTQFSMIKTTLPPGGTIWLVAETTAEATPVRAVFQDAEGDARVVSATALEARVIANWLTVIAVSFALTVIAFAIWMVLVLVGFRKPTTSDTSAKSPAAKGGAVDAKPNVTA